MEAAKIPAEFRMSAAQLRTLKYVRAARPTIGNYSRAFRFPTRRILQDRGFIAHTDVAAGLMAVWYVTELGFRAIVANGGMPEATRRKLVADQLRVRCAREGFEVVAVTPASVVDASGSPAILYALLEGGTP